MPAPKPTFRLKGRCIVSDHPKLKRDNIVFSARDGQITVQRVIGKDKRRVKWAWPKNLVLVVRKPAVNQIIKFAVPTPRKPRAQAVLPTQPAPMPTARQQK